jgi:hypothetical protein
MSTDGCKVFLTQLSKVSKMTSRSAKFVFEGSLGHSLHFFLKQILPIANFHICLDIAASFLRRAIRLFSFKKPPTTEEGNG